MYIEQQNVGLEGGMEEANIPQVLLGKGPQFEVDDDDDDEEEEEEEEDVKAKWENL